MKLIYFIFFAIFLFLIFTGNKVIAQSSRAKVICLYRLTSRPDSTSKTTWEELTQLAISDSSSEFRSFVRYKADSLILKYQYADLNSPAMYAGMTEATNLPKYKFDGVIIKNSKTTTCLYYGIINKILYSYQDNDYSLNWKLSTDTARINGYTCQKAFTKLGGRKYTAWFTRQIPISNGPYKFGGLPGLIVSISDSTGSYKFELTRIYQPAKEYRILLPSQLMRTKLPAIVVPKRHYYSSYFTARDNFIDNAIANGTIKSGDLENVRKTYRDKIKHLNNPIELDYKKQ
ncbi:GLPGLI family protein [Hymenobacter rubripertinctus]|uniref:GLPGLI family protein n=1 Tax=Hymenobacter rubripertinctus TaxID=2029981 RepID=A0A418QV21_9BACT|nr:GLPGLI family protein [Hymenobacter rubripertinctus]RIY09082.1 GLPGLI family protein [Hymenobacter rubripertinctus]